MMPSVHILMATTVAVRTKKPRTSVFWLPPLMLVAHFFLDLTPHLDPDLLGGEKYTNPQSFAFWWSFVDIMVATYLTAKIIITFPEYWKVICLCYVAAIGPDVLQALGMVSFLPKPQWLQGYTDAHSYTHAWWKENWPRPVSISVGTITSILFWWAAWRFAPTKDAKERASEKQPATATA